MGISVIRYRLAILLVTVVMAGLAAAQLPKLSVATSVESMFRRHEQILTDYQRFRSQSGRDEEIVLLISSPDIFSLGFLTTLKQYQAPNFSIAFCGTPVYQYHVEPLVRSNMKKMCIAILIVSVLLLPILFGRGKSAYLPQLTGAVA